MDTTTPPPAPSSPPPVTSPRTWAVLCHATALSGVVLHVFGFVLGPLVVWLAKRGESAEIDAHGKESLNFQLSMLLWSLIASILIVVLIGIPILIGLYVINIVLTIIASLKASEGTLYRYPLTIRFLG